MITLRVILIGLGALLGLALVAHGNIVIGGLVLLMAVVRAVMVIRMHRGRGRRLARREAFMAQRRTRRGL